MAWTKQQVCVPRKKSEDLIYFKWKTDNFLQFCPLINDIFKIPGNQITRLSLKKKKKKKKEGEDEEDERKEEARMRGGNSQ